MSKRLTQNLNSAYFEAANRLKPSSSRRRIIAYVESYEDVAFWRSVLDEFETSELYFEVKLPGRDSLQKGKRQAITNILSADQLGTAMIACVDADYDYLLQDTTEASMSFNRSPFIVHTFVYAIESYQCYAPSLHRAVVTATLNDRPTLNFEEFLREYSQIIWPLFLWNVWGYRHENYKGFTMLDFCGFISFRDINISRPDESLSLLRRRVNQKMAWLQNRHPEAKKSYANLKQQLRDLGITPDTTYLYVQGHTLFENVVMPLLEPICNMLRKEREREIKQLAVHPQQRQCELSAYQHAVIPIDIVLKKNTAFKDAPPFQRVREAIQRVIAMQKTSSSTSSPSSAQ
ncbi:MAG: DUF4435 domain-containing protein [Bacteroidaceae bacterium]|nr:DUF4435 domain-containing protein [Bacteroidaceae bacterium]